MSLRFAVVVILLVVMALSLNSGEQKLFRPLTESEVEKFVEAYKINAIAVKNVGNSTVILYSNTHEDGYFVLSVCGGEVKWTRASAGCTMPVSVAYHASGAPFAVVVFHDDDFRSKVKRVEVVCADCSAVEEVSGEGLIIPLTGSELDTCKVVFLDEDNRTVDAPAGI